MSKFIKIRGARVNNLKNINVEIPRNKLVVITGISGSGKSSLAFDTIYAEGQRRYVESLSNYARQFLGLMDKPDVDSLEGLSPAISLDQRATASNPRSTVGTMTEIYDYLRLLFSRIGHVHCPKCGQEVFQQSPAQIVNKILKLKKGLITIMAPVTIETGEEYQKVLTEIQKAGFQEVRFNGRFFNIVQARDLKIDKKDSSRLEIVINKLILDTNHKNHQITDNLERAVESALDLGNGQLIIRQQNLDKDLLFSQQFNCPQCNINLPNLEPRNFSFNSPAGACPKCLGLGTELKVDPDLVIPNKRLTLAQGAIKPWARSFSNQSKYWKLLEAVSKIYNFSLNQPLQNFKSEDLKIVLYGTGDKLYDLGGGDKSTFEGVVPLLEKKYQQTSSDYLQKEIEQYMRVTICQQCQGKRLKSEVLKVTVLDKNISEITDLTIDSLVEFFKILNKKNNTKESALATKERKVIEEISKEVLSRLKYLNDVGLGYLTLSRTSTTLAGGEFQRIRLATQLGLSLSGIIYILDEPSIGLHQRDNQKLIDTLKHLRNLDNTVIVVEHDKMMMLEADEIIDIGPGAGEAGGKVIAQGTPQNIKKSSNSLTGKYLAGRLTIEVPKKFREGNGKYLEILGATEFNLKNIDVKIALGKLVCVTGVSGSGKSTLILEILAKALAKKFYRAKDLAGKHREIRGVNNIDKVISIDQSPIGRTPRSNAATYTGVFTYIRDLFAQTNEAKIRGYDVGKFSFNAKGGRCENCAGEGLVKVEMQFLPDIYVRCEECQGKRYKAEVLEIHYQGKNISEVLETSVLEALSFFRNNSLIFEKLKTLNDVGLGYIKLGQSATTLSGGEAQRVKLATELSRRSTGKTLYILDEPTTGLHFEDIKKLLDVLNKLVDKGNTVLIIEHNLDVIKCADWLIDLGPKGGEAGGYIIAEGTPKDVSKIKKSYTGQYLKEELK